MGTQTSTIQFIGGVENLRGFKRYHNTKGINFIGKKGGANQSRFNVLHKMEINRMMCNEFQGCIGLSMALYNDVKNYFHMDGMKFKQAIFNLMRKQITLGTQNIGYRDLFVSAGSGIPIPTKVGYHSLDYIINNKWISSIDIAGMFFHWNLTPGASIDLFKHSRNATHFRYIAVVCKISDWFADEARQNKYFPVVTSFDDNVVVEISVPHSLAPISLGFNINLDISRIIYDFHSNIVGCVGIETGKIINGIFYADIMFCGSSITAFAV